MAWLCLGGWIVFGLALGVFLARLVYGFLHT